MADEIARQRPAVLGLQEGYVLDVIPAYLGLPGGPIHMDFLGALQAALAARGLTYTVALPAGVRNQFLQGTWDGTRVLLDAGERIRQTAERLPYVRGFGK